MVFIPVLVFLKILLMMKLKRKSLFELLIGLIMINGDYGIWQYSSKGKINGIQGNVDLDYGFVDYEKIIVEK